MLFALTIIRILYILLVGTYYYREICYLEQIHLLGRPRFKYLHQRLFYQLSCVFLSLISQCYASSRNLWLLTCRYFTYYVILGVNTLHIIASFKFYIVQVLPLLKVKCFFFLEVKTSLVLGHFELQRTITRCFINIYQIHGHEVLLRQLLANFKRDNSHKFVQAFLGNGCQVLE